MEQAALRQHGVEGLGRGEEECDEHPDVCHIREGRKLAPHPLVKSNQMAPNEEKH